MRTAPLIVLAAGLLVATGPACSRRTGPVTIKVATRTHPFLLAHKALLETDFKKRFHKNLQFMLLDTTIYENDLLRLLSGPDTDIPDIAEMDQPLKFKYLQAVEPLNRRLESWDRWRQDDGLQDFMKLRRDPQGTIVGICRHYPEPLVILLRRDWLEGSGFAFPATIEQMLAIIKYFSSEPFRRRWKHPVYAWAWEPRLPHLVLKAYDNAVVEYNPKTGKYVPGFTSSMGKAELSTLCDLHRQGALPPDLFQARPGAMAALFREHRLGMLLTSLTQGLALVRQLGSTQAELGGLPRGSVKPANGIASAWCLISLGTHATEAWDFYRWWFSPETFELLCFGFKGPDSLATGTGYIHPLLSLFEQQTRVLARSDPLARQVHDLIIHEKMQFSEHPCQREIEDIVQAYYRYALEGSLSVDEALQRAVIKIHKMHLLN